MRWMLFNISLEKYREKKPKWKRGSTMSFFFFSQNNKLGEKKNGTTYISGWLNRDLQYAEIQKPKAIQNLKVFTLNPYIETGTCPTKHLTQCNVVKDKLVVWLSLANQTRKREIRQISLTAHTDTHKKRHLLIVMINGKVRAHKKKRVRVNVKDVHI